MLDVTAGVIWGSGGVLVCRRPPGDRLGGLWEFPGGKIEDGEDARACLKRELREELGLETEIGEAVGVVTHHYPWGGVRLHVFVASIAGGEPCAHAHDAVCWMAPARLRELAFAPADRPIVEALAAGTIRG